MGVCRWLISVDPDIWEKASTLIVEEKPDTIESGNNFLSQFGKTFNEEDYCFSPEDGDDELEFFLNQVFEQAVTTDHHYLDKSLSLFEDLLKFIPSLKPLNDIYEFKGITVECPDICGPTDSGLFGAISEESLEKCTKVIKRFETTEELITALNDYKPSFIQRIFSSKANIAELKSNLGEEYYIDCWKTFRDAILQASEKGHLLGLGMSV